MSWDPVLYDGGLSYNIYRDGVKKATVTNATYTDTGLTTLTKYVYEVSAESKGVESPKSNKVTATTI